ncbi:MAG: 50S ribosomal protein L30 [Spirochaetales bacterium]|nr:50S ribosomal protein L30 [Spirochaetales bacterium]
MAKKVKKVRIQLVRSTIGQKPMHRKTVKALGLGKMNSSVEKEATPMIMGMAAKVSHLIKVEEIS